MCVSASIGIGCLRVTILLYIGGGKTLLCRYGRYGLTWTLHSPSEILDIEFLPSSAQGQSEYKPCEPCLHQHQLCFTANSQV